MSQHAAISQKILDAYKRNQKDLPLKASGAFFIRAYKMTGDRQHEEIITEYVAQKTLPRFHTLSRSLQRGDLKAPLHQATSERGKKRMSFYKKNCAVGFYDDLLVELFSLWRYNLHATSHKKEFQAVCASLRKIDFAALYAQSDTIRYNSSFAANSIFFLRAISLCDHVSVFCTAVKKYCNEEVFDTREIWDQQSLIYTLTHIIIANSHYYERPVSDYGWILRFFDAHHESILKNCSLDIIAEVALCFRLHNTTTPVSENITAFVVARIQKRDFADIHFLIKRYHTNYIVMLLTAKTLCYALGPDLSAHFSKAAKKI